MNRYFLTLLSIVILSTTVFAQKTKLNTDNQIAIII